MSAAAGDFALSLRAVGKRYGRIRALEGAFAAASSGYAAIQEFERWMGVD